MFDRNLTGSRLRVLIMIAVLLLIAWWASFWIQIDRTVLTRVPVLDEAYYLETAAIIGEGKYLPDEPFVMSPLYPYLIALTGSGRHLADNGVREGLPPLGIRLVQVVGWLVLIVLLYRITRDVLPVDRRTRWVVLVPPVLFALYRPASVFATTTLLEIPLTVTVMACLYLVTQMIPTSSVTTADGPISTGKCGPGDATDHAVTAGVLIGLAALLRGHGLLLLLPGWWALWLSHPTVPQRIKRMAILTAATMAVIAPVVGFNSWQAGRPAGISQNGGLNFYIGSGPEAAGLFTTFAGFDFEGDPAGVEFLSHRLQRRVGGPAEADHVWWEETWRSVQENPGRTLQLWCKKVWLHLQNWEISQLTPLEAWAREVPQLRLLLIPYGLIAGLGLAGLLLCVRRRRRLWPWAAALMVLVAGQSVFFVVSRYRLVIVPILCLLAGLGIARLITSRGRTRFLTALTMVLCLVAAWPWGLGEVRRGWQVLGFENEAIRWERLGGPAALAKAEILYREAITKGPARGFSYQGLGRILVQTDRSLEAEQVLNSGILRAETTESLERELIALLLEYHKIPEAVTRLQAFIAEYGEDPQMLHNLSVALAQIGRTTAAIDVARRLLVVSPNHPQSYIDLGVLLARCGRPDDARLVFEAGLTRFPTENDLLHNLEQLPPAE